MTSEDGTSEFHRGQRISFQMELTPGQHTAMREWAASIPTLYFLDICVANMAKRVTPDSGRNSRKSAILRRLRELDRPQHSFSYLLALMEKVSDTQGSLSEADLEREVLGDVGALRRFFKNARVLEADEFIINYTRELRRVAPEPSRPDYLRFLETANNRFALRDPVSPIRRLQKAKELLEAARDLSVPKQHPVVLVSLACLYGNRSAKKLMKFKADARRFNAENALADIMVIGRFAPLKLQIEQEGRSGGSAFLRSEFLTDDSGLSGVLPCFEAQVVRHEAIGGVNQTRIDLTVKLDHLLPDLKVDGQEPDEFAQLCALITQ